MTGPLCGLHGVSLEQSIDGVRLNSGKSKQIIEHILGSEPQLCFEVTRAMAKIRCLLVCSSLYIFVRFDQLTWSRFCSR